MGHFIKYALLFHIWLVSHFSLEESRTLHYFLPSFSHNSKVLEKEWPYDKSEEKWVQKFQNLKEEEATWKAF